MKRNIAIVVTYAVGFVLFNILVGVYIAFNQDLVLDETALNQTFTVLTASFYLVMTFTLIIVFRKYLWEQIKHFSVHYKRIFFSIFGGIVGIYTVMFFLAIILQIIGVTEEADNQQGILDMISSATPLNMVLILAFVCVLAPITEEIVFRKGMYGVVGILTARFFHQREAKHTTTYANIAGILVSSLIFGAIHATDIYLLLYSGLGAVLGLIYYFSNKNIYAPIVVHMIYNTISIVITLTFT